MQRSNTFASLRATGQANRPSQHSAPPQDDNPVELIVDRERFNLHLLVAMIVVGDAEQCLALCLKYFNEDLTSSRRLLYRANLLRIKAFATLLEHLSDAGGDNREHELQEAEAETEDALSFFASMVQSPAPLEQKLGFYGSALCQLQLSVLHGRKVPAGYDPKVHNDPIAQKAIATKVTHL